MSITSVDGDSTHTGWQWMRERLAFVWLEVREAAQILRLYSLVWFQGTPVVRRIKTTRDNVKCSRYTSDLLLNSQPEDVLCLLHTNKQDMFKHRRFVFFTEPTCGSWKSYGSTNPGLSLLPICMRNKITVIARLETAGSNPHCGQCDFQFVHCRVFL